MANPAFATGGTARITAAARGFDPFVAAPASGCDLSCAATIGPCHAESPLRVDISDGRDGLPMRLVLRIVDSECRPVPDAIVEVWHTDHAGGYSGRAARMCNRDVADRERSFFRGYQRADASGRVGFDSCYPGWYRGRAVHVHLRILTGRYAADDGAPAAVTTQLLFGDALNEAIFGTEPLYRDAGQPDTTLADDGVIGAADRGAGDRGAAGRDVASGRPIGGEPGVDRRWLFDVARVDGVLVASKTLVIRRRLDEPLCEAAGGGPPRGRRGPRGGGPPGAMPGHFPGPVHGEPQGQPPGQPPARPSLQALSSGVSVGRRPDRDR